MKGVYMSVKEKIELLEKSLELLSLAGQEINAGVNVLSELSKVLGYKIPCEIYYFLKNSTWFNENLSNELLGFESFSYEDISSDMMSGQPFGFYATFEASESFELTGSACIYIDEETNPVLGSSRQVSNISRFFPVSTFQGDFLAIDLNAEHYGNFMLLEGFNAFLVAPSLKAHIEDLINGLSLGVYFIDEYGGVVFPSLWSQRVDLIEGRLKMDEYGDVID